MRIRTITMPDDDTGELIIPNPDAGYAGEGNATQLAIVPTHYPTTAITQDNAVKASITAAVKVAD